MIYVTCQVNINLDGQPFSCFSAMPPESPSDSTLLTGGATLNDDE
ncbi:hypothetical protein [Deinococcus ruber]|nr:hypothetical protein [Deinococcus ruber]